MPAAAAASAASLSASSDVSVRKRTPAARVKPAAAALFTPSPQGTALQAPAPTSESAEPRRALERLPSKSVSTVGLGRPRKVEAEVPCFLPFF